jgi:hypothetical protein
MIVMPKLNETVEVLQALINDLQPSGSEPADEETDDPSEMDSI